MVLFPLWAGRNSSVGPEQRFWIFIQVVCCRDRARTLHCILRDQGAVVGFTAELRLQTQLKIPPPHLPRHLLFRVLAYRLQVNHLVTWTARAGVYLGGVGAEDENSAQGGDIRHLGDFGAQCRYAWDKIKRLLEKHGATVENIDKVVTYVTDIRFSLKRANAVQRRTRAQPNLLARFSS
jgi:enamine deaminase RidA (YjgF/YER057c/UK114 family)